MRNARRVVREAAVAGALLLGLGACGREEPWDPRGTWHALAESAASPGDGAPGLAFKGALDDVRLHLEAHGLARIACPALEAHFARIDARFASELPGRPAPPRDHPKPVAVVGWAPTPEGFEVTLDERTRLEFRRVGPDRVELVAPAEVNVEGNAVRLPLGERLERRR